MSIEVLVKVDVVVKEPPKRPPQAPFPGKKGKEKADAKFGEVVGRRGAPVFPHAKPLYPKPKYEPHHGHQPYSSGSGRHAIVGARKIAPPPKRTPPPMAYYKAEVLKGSHAIPGARNLHGNG